MSVVFSTAKNGRKICSYNEILLHSSYDPIKEAERFVTAISCDFIPSFVVITEPVLSYCVPFLRTRFPKSKLCAIRYVAFFSETDKYWDYIFDGTLPGDILGERIFSALGEEGICSSVFESWKPSGRAFPSAESTVWETIRDAVIKSRSILSTRSFFAERWLKNTCIFCTNATQICTIDKGTAPVIVTASGPSLTSSIPFLKQYRNKYFLIAVSSSIAVLLYNRIFPDLCISTDGGYWAKQHLFPLVQSNTKIPIAQSAEAAAVPELLKGNPIIPLSYGNDQASLFLEACGLISLHAERNGTVSGTAVELALSISTGSVFCCGLDLCKTLGFQHSQPNALELFDSRYDNRLATKEMRTAKKAMSSGALEIYRSWFSSRNSTFSARVFRLSDNVRFSSTLGTIKDIDWKDFISLDIQGKKPIIRRLSDVPDLYRNRKNIENIIESNRNKHEWLENAFPTDYILYERSSNYITKKMYYDKIVKKNSKLIEALKKVIRE